MLILVKPLRFLFFALSLTGLGFNLGCHAQLPLKTPSQNEGTLSPEMARRVAVLIRSRSDIPPEYAIHVGPRMKSDVPGYDAITVEFSAEGKTARPIPFLLSTDGKTLAQFTRYDISKDPKALVSGADRPSRGGAADAPVLIVVYDDLECPYCAKMNAQMIPAVLERYKGQVRVVYKDWPEDQHPWAMRAAIDTNCVAAQSAAGYWDLIDSIHARAEEFGGTERSLVKANEMLDSMTKDEAKKQKIDTARVDACIAKQDSSAIKLSLKEGEALGVDSTPALFINGEKIEGAQPTPYIYRTIDGALIAAGQTPPPSAADQASPAKSASSRDKPQTTPAKPGS